MYLKNAEIGRKNADKVSKTDNYVFALEGCLKIDLQIRALMKSSNGEGAYFCKIDC